MSDLYFLSFRDVASNSVGVTAGEVYRQASVTAGSAWSGLNPGDMKWVPWADVGALFAGQHVCFVIHGFNVSARDGFRSGGAIAQECERLGTMGLAMTGADVVVTVLWPGDGLLGWNWFTAWPHGLATSANFCDFLLSSAFKADEVSFITHSLGARIAFQTIDATLAAKNAAPRFRYSTAVLLAAAVDASALDEEFAPAVAALERVVVLSSKQDKTLKTWFTIGDTAESVLINTYTGDGSGNALGRFGPKFKDGSPAIAKTEWYQIDSDWKQDHGDYMPTLSDPQPNMTNGWSDRRGNVAQFYVDVFNPAPFNLPRWNGGQRQGWAQDRTDEFRAGWKPKM